MKIAIIGPGIMPIPPRGWGAVEILIHEYRVELEKQGVEVLIINTSDRAEIVAHINAFNPDFVHCQYDEFIDVLAGIECPAKAITSHFGYLEQVWKYQDYLHKIHGTIVRSEDVLIFALSPSIAEAYRRDGVAQSRLFVMPNGVRHELFRFTDQPRHHDRSIYLAKIDYRKRQGTFQSYDASIDFAGNLCPHSAVTSGFDPAKPDYLGEWSKQDVYEKMTDYANLVLLSDGEAHPLVCLEAMAAGLGLVVSQYATANLDLTKPFIDVIPEARIGDREYVRQVIRQNRVKSLQHRQDIHAYAEQLAWGYVVKRYMDVVVDIVRKKKAMALNVAAPAKPKLAIVTVATGKYYDLFFRDFEASVLAKLAPGREVKIYCFTDYQGSAGRSTEICPARHMGWPFDTLLRFHLMAGILDRLMTHDFVLYLDSDMTVQDTLDPEILKADLIAVRHPGFFENPSAASFEIDATESTFVSLQKRKDQEYVQGCFWGGKPFAFKDLVLTLARKIDADLACGMIPVWHDESYLNWYMADHPFLSVSPAYAFPEDSNLPFKPIILHRAKNHRQARDSDFDGILASKIITGLSLQEQADAYRLLYLRAHEKNQTLEHYILRSGRARFYIARLLAPLPRRVRNRLQFLLRDDPPNAGPRIAAELPLPPKTIDVVVPMYNNEQYAIDAIHSALTQTFPVRKVIVVDDGSTDRSAAIVEAHFAENPRVTLVRAAHAGLPAARNRGLERTDAEFIAFLDSDDIWYPEKLEWQMGVFEARPDIGLVYCSHDDIDSDGRPLSAPHRLIPRLRGFVHNDILRGNFISGGSAALIRREHLARAGMFDENLSYAEDWDMWLRLAKLCPFDYVGDALLAIRRHPAQMSAGNSYAQRIHRLIQHIRILSKWPEDVSRNEEILQVVRGDFLSPCLKDGISLKRRLAILRVMKKRIGIHIHPRIFKAACKGNLYLYLRIAYRAVADSGDRGRQRFLSVYKIRRVFGMFKRGQWHMIRHHVAVRLPGLRRIKRKLFPRAASPIGKGE